MLEEALRRLPAVPELPFLITRQAVFSFVSLGPASEIHVFMNMRLETAP